MKWQRTMSSVGKLGRETATRRERIKAQKRRTVPGMKKARAAMTVVSDQEPWTSSRVGHDLYGWRALQVVPLGQTHCQFGGVPLCHHSSKQTKINNISIYRADASYMQMDLCHSGRSNVICTLRKSLFAERSNVQIVSSRCARQYLIAGCGFKLCLDFCRHVLMFVLASFVIPAQKGRHLLAKYYNLTLK